MVARAAALEKQVDLNPETIRYQHANADRDRALADALAWWRREPASFNCPFLKRSRRKDGRSCPSPMERLQQ
jgi:hypothetical protein